MDHLPHHAAHCLPQAIELIEQIEDDFHSLVIDAEIVLQIANELCPRQIGFRQMQVVRS